ncbi:peptidoglycan-binding protein [Nostoc sp. FACHB-152]|uniref:peptidoglycan-binding domain-containing protein n=1 Tax=unclassified Nostoc TaxID=2593658 RepID=UPI0016855450|nr:MULTISPECIES: peptidoglycan-binding domain-containing protein [unclassified Nostoc]MBD2450608.1 peptidoglycan-binding protein [Nostoc sp. FACHB-152]MBD2471243.1 peptidoglycan-binding protein [Nostoc sp. FACHB-145]
MTGSLRASILSAKKLYRLLLLFSTPWLMNFWPGVAIAAPQKVAQAVTGASINRPTLRVGSQGDRVSELQAALQLLGFYSGKVDGVYSDNTANAVSRFQQAVGLNPNGVVDAATWQKLFPKEPASTSNTAAALLAPSGQNTNTAKPEPRPANPRNRATQVPTLAPEPRPANRRTSTNQNRTSARSSSSTRSTPAITFRQVPGLQYTSEGYPILRLGNQGSEVTTLQRQLQRFGFLSSSNIDGDFGRSTEAAVKALQRRYGLEDDGVAGGATWEILLQRSPRQR